MELQYRTVVYTYFNSGGQGHLMPVAVDPKSSRLSVSVCHGDGSITVECHRVPQAAQPSATRPWIGPRATRGPMSWSAGTQRSRGAHSAEAMSSSLPGKLLLPGSCVSGTVLSLVRPSRQAPLAGVSVLCLVYFVFEWFNKEQEGLRRARGKPCRGKLQLPVHKLGY